MKSDFEWDIAKNKSNLDKHNIDFETAQYAFADKKRVILRDLAHSTQEERFYCIGEIDGAIVTVRFTYRNNKIRIFGAGFWRKGKEIYEKENSLHK